MSDIIILKGNFVHAPALDELECIERGYLVAKAGRIEGLYGELPGKYAACEVTDLGDAIVTPSFSDMHLHAPQWSMLGLGMDLQLIEWLSTYAYKAEAMYADTEFARSAYRQLAAQLVARGTTRVCMFSSLHAPATLILMEELERAGVTGLVGKVNMDRNSSEELNESTEESKRSTLDWLEACVGFEHVKPMITPRFTPSCTDELMAWLGEIAVERNLPVQSHLSENLDEMAWVRSLHPDCERYWETYAKYGMWKPGTVMAHCVHCDEVERAAIKRYGVTVAHCPDSNLNIASGIAPIRRMLDEGIHVTLGSDIAGGACLSMPEVARLAIRCSKQRYYEDKAEPFLTVKEAFYMLTSAGQEYFSEQPGFKRGNMLHAVAFNEARMPLTKRRLSLEERLERLIYLADDRDISAVYSEGKRIK